MTVERFIDGGWNVDPLNGTLNECRPCQENTTLFGDGFRCAMFSEMSKLEMKFYAVFPNHLL